MNLNGSRNSMSMKKILILLPCLILIAGACKKERNPNPDAKEQALLLSKGWKYALNDKNPSTNPSGEIVYVAMPACALDDVYKFGIYNQLKVDRGEEKCDPGEERGFDTNYSVDFPTGKVVFEDKEYTLAEVSATQLKFYQTTTLPAGQSHLVLIFEH